MSGFENNSQKQLERVRRLALALPEALERLSHGEPTFFVRKKVFAMFSKNHHNDGHLGVWIPVPAGFQEGLINSNPEIFYFPPYMGKRGWVGVELEQINDAELEFHLHTAWELIAPERLVAENLESRKG